MAHIGDNGGPPDLPLTAKTKLECIQSILERSDLTAAQKCIGAGIVLEADREWVSEVKTPDLQRYASAKDRETVFRATRELDKKGVVSKSSARGQSGKFTVLPPRVVKAVIDAYDEIKSGRDKADHISESGRVKPDGISSRVPTSNAVGIDPTSPVKPVGFDPTARPCARGSNINNNINNINNLPTHPEPHVMRVGEEDFGNGVFVNCETVRHKEFSISIKGIEMQLATCAIDLTPEQRKEAARASAIGHAIQWALDIDNGKRPDLVVPSHPANFIRGAIVQQHAKTARSRSGGRAEPPKLSNAERIAAALARAEAKQGGAKHER